jgi:hypothetical protein
MTTSALITETSADLAARHVHAHVEVDEREHLRLVTDRGTSPEERAAAAAILWLHLHRAAASEVH